MTSRLRSLFRLSKNKSEKRTAADEDLSESESETDFLPFILNGETRFNYKPFDKKYIVSF